MNLAPAFPSYNQGFFTYLRAVGVNHQDGNTTLYIWDKWYIHGTITNFHRCPGWRPAPVPGLAMVCLHSMDSSSIEVQVESESMAKHMSPALDGFLHTFSPLIGLSGHVSLCGWLHSKEALTATSRGNDRMDVILHDASKCDVTVVAVGSNALELEAIPMGSKILIYAGPTKSTFGISR